MSNLVLRLGFSNLNRSYNLRIRPQVEKWLFDFGGRNFIPLICVTHPNVMAMYARTCSHFKLAGGHHLESMPMFSGFGLVRVKYVILSVQNRTHRSVNADLD